jgi:hypothetical protein
VGPGEASQALSSVEGAGFMVGEMVVERKVGLVRVCLARAFLF